MSFYRTMGMALAGAGMLVACGGAMAQEASTGSSWTGHIDVVSRYVLRGITDTYGPGSPGGNKNGDAPESDHPAVQWGADWTNPAGFYLGYWGSTINYSYEKLGDLYHNPNGTYDFQDNKSIENDLYGGYTGKVGDFGYTIGMTGYVYINGRDSDALESKLGVSYGDFALNAQTLLKDTVWGNKGDTYYTLNYSKSLPYKLTLNASLGYYTYHKEGTFLGTKDTLNGTDCPAGEVFSLVCTAGHSPISNGFRHFIIGISQPIGDTHVTWGLSAIIGGENRFGVDQSNKVLASLSYGF